MTIRKLTALLIKVISLFLLLKEVLHFSLSAISIGTYFFSFSRTRLSSDLWIAMRVGSTMRWLSA